MKNKKLLISTCIFVLLFAVTFGIDISGMISRWIQAGVENRKQKHEEKMLELDNIRIKNDDDVSLERKKIDNSLYIEGRKIDSNEMIQNDVNSIKKDELRQEKKKFLNDNIGNYLKIGVQAAGIIIPTIFYGNWIREGLEFEKTGTFTSKTFTGLLSKIKPN